MSSPAFVALIIGSTIFAGFTRRRRIPIKLIIPIFTPDAIAEIQSPTGTKVKDCWGANYVIADDVLILSSLSWSQNIPSGTINENVGFQLETLKIAPVEVELISFTGVNDNQEDVEFKI